jgi:hypothetical protein
VDPGYRVREKNSKAFETFFYSENGGKGNWTGGK